MNTSLPKSPRPLSLTAFILIGIIIAVIIFFVVGFILLSGTGASPR